MSKRRRKRRHGTPSEREPRAYPAASPTSSDELPAVPASQELRSRRRVADDLPAALDQAERLIAGGRAQEAVELLEPFLETHAYVPDLYAYLAYARAESGDVWGGVDEYERALELSRNPAYWLPVAALYAAVGLRVHALRAFRQVLKRQPDAPAIDQVRATVSEIEEDVAGLARRLGLAVRWVEEGVWHMEEGQRALNRGDFPASIAASQRAIKVSREWPPPLNNLSLALFFDGQPEQAIAAAQRVLSRAPDNVQALSNAIRFLAWTGQEAQAQALWARLKAITPDDPTGRFKMAEAAATLGEDESVYQLLQPLDEAGAAQEELPRFARRIQLFLAVAEANTGRQPQAQRRLRALQHDTPLAGEFLAALRDGRPGPGWAERFPYFHSTELVPRSAMGKFVELVERQNDLSPRRFRDQVARLAARFPQLVLVAEKMIWEEHEPMAGVAILSTVATPAAYAALRRFGLSQAGEDRWRLEALTSLAHAGEIAEDAPVRMWAQGEWKDVLLRQYEISDRPTVQYTPQVAELLNQGLHAYQHDDDQQAEQLFRRALELDSRAKEAYNNLGALYAHRGDHARAREAFQAALEIDPLYTFPRCNLATYLLDEGDVEGAEELLKPLADATHFHPQEMAFYSYTQARIAIQRQEYEVARHALQLALQVWPDYEPAKNLLARLDVMGRMQGGFASWMEERRERERAARARLQARLSTPAPALSLALSLYTKNALVGMAREVLPWGGRGALRKAELLQHIVERLSEPGNLARVVAGLADDERAALRDVLARGGTMDWREFDAAYGNDVDESAYWEWHTPKTLMGRLRQRGLLVETTVEGALLVAVPADLRQALGKTLALDADSTDAHG